ncbi:competence type IV pilus ATPase ComGA [Lapidilactobacillus bayanensis]|uniref:competence type IV pilus ATPase ComGA n=1 Tax=Lapidilactobacillus bayanensis TaxID=2485998 RepID=UPI000F77A85B|nr:competence type IV pilus ATPase ComGA [Lapidilactobacillus bayanensis]
MTIANDVHDLVTTALTCNYNDLFFKPLVDGWQLLGRNVQATTQIKQLSLEQGQTMINYLKFQAQMDLSEHRRPQIGAWHYHHDELGVDLRLATVGDYLNRESLVIRFLSQKIEHCQFINPERYQELRALLNRRGLLVFAGPTGSGKTTLMYHLAQELSQQATVLTIEDPTEIVEPNFIQLQVNEEAQMTYTALLKISLRLRPDILVIGEIRDSETAAIAIQAALSGHLVLATIHARSASGVVERLLDLQINTSALANSLTASCYQRLLPTTDNETLKLAIDLLTPTEIAAVIQQPTQQTNNWWTDLQTAQKNGVITEETLQNYRWG